MDENCHVDPIDKKATASELSQVKIGLLAVQGMGCPNCAARVRNGLVRQTGVIDARVDHELGMAQVAYNPGLVTIQDLIQAVINAGNDGRHEYRAELIA